MSSARPRRIFGILALAAGIVLIMLEVGSYRQGGEISWFWIAVAGLAIVLGIYDISAKPKKS